MYLVKENFIQRLASMGGIVEQTIWSSKKISLRPTHLHHILEKARACALRIMRRATAAAQRQVPRKGPEDQVSRSGRRRQHSETGCPEHMLAGDVALGVPPPCVRWRPELGTGEKHSEIGSDRAESLKCWICVLVGKGGRPAPKHSLHVGHQRTWQSSQRKHFQNQLN